MVGRWISPEPNVYDGEFDSGAGFLAYNVYGTSFIKKRGERMFIVALCDDNAEFMDLEEKIILKDDYIKLGQALKAANFVDSGVDAKYAYRRYYCSGSFRDI